MFTPYITQTLYNLWQETINLKNLLFKSMLAAVMYFSGIHHYLISVFSLLLLDVITGLWAAKKRGDKITSRKLRKGLLEKFALYIILFVSAFMLEQVIQHIIPYSHFFIAWILAIIVNVYEITSIIENTIEIYPDLSFLNKFKEFLNRLEDKQIKAIEDKFDLFNEPKKDETNTN